MPTTIPESAKDAQIRRQKNLDILLPVIEKGVDKLLDSCNGHALHFKTFQDFMDGCSKMLANILSDNEKEPLDIQTEYIAMFFRQLEAIVRLHLENYNMLHKWYVFGIPVWKKTTKFPVISIPSHLIRGKTILEYPLMATWKVYKDIGYMDLTVPPLTEEQKSQTLNFPVSVRLFTA